MLFMKSLRKFKNFRRLFLLSSDKVSRKLCRSHRIPIEVCRLCPAQAENGTGHLITLNTNILDSASQEYILVTMYHEVLHAYLYSLKQELGAVAFQQNYPTIVEYSPLREDPSI